MREKIRDKERLEHILNSINVILSSKEKHTFEEVSTDPIVFYGFVKQVEIIGEAVYMLTKEFRIEHNELPWDDIERMRHVLVHGYYKIRPDQLWETIQNDIPTMKPFIEKMISEME
ncbi:MAG: DUF86 domain-containing protein [Bacteroidales bacterium]|nr:DUF86 domain-containing protein [Bacteroidales bacterium]